MKFIKFPVELLELKDAEKIALLMRIILRMDAQGNGVCFETRTVMCENLNMNRKAWTRKIRELESSGLILVQRKAKVPNQITLTENVKTFLRGQNDPLTRSNINIDWGSKRPRKEDHMESEKPKEKKKSAVRKRPANKIQRSAKQKRSDPPLSEIDKIHRQWVKKKANDSDPTV